MSLEALRVGVDATCWNNRRGYGRHLRSLVRAIAGAERRPKLTLFFDSPAAVDYPVPAGIEVVEIAARVPAAEAARSGGRRSIGDMAKFGRTLSRAAVDVLLFPTVYSFVPVWSRAVKVVMIHDVIAERMPRAVFPTRADELRWRLKSALARRQADWIVTVSDYSRRLLIDEFRLPPERVLVIGEAPDPVFRPLEGAALPAAAAGRGVRADARLVSCVGGFAPHKNLTRLVEAFARLTARSAFDDVQLVLVGDDRGDPFFSRHEELKRRVSELGLEGKVVFTGFLSDAHVAALLNRSRLLVLPSLMEGFGLPGVEAAACGVPVAATKHSPLPELLGEGVLTIDPENPIEIERAMERVLADEAVGQRLGQQALKAASKLDSLGVAWRFSKVMTTISAETPRLFD